MGWSCAFSITPQAWMESMQSIVWNPSQDGMKSTQGVGWNRVAGNVPLVMPYAYGDYILTYGEIIYQGCGLDKKDILAF